MILEIDKSVLDLLPTLAAQLPQTRRYVGYLRSLKLTNDGFSVSIGPVRVTLVVESWSGYTWATEYHGDLILSVEDVKVAGLFSVARLVRPKILDAMKAMPNVRITNGDKIAVKVPGLFITSAYCRTWGAEIEAEVQSGQ